jgi:hypothetical protein
MTAVCLVGAMDEHLVVSMAETKVYAMVGNWVK